MSFKDKILNNQSPWGSPPGGSGNGSVRRCPTPPNIDEIIKNLQDKIMSGEQIAKHEKYIHDLNTENMAFGKIVYTNQNYNQAIFGKDTRPTELFKQDMYKTDGSKKYLDMKESFTPDLIKLSNPAETYGTFGKGSVAPPKFIDQPGVKYTNDSIYTAMTK